MRSSLLKVALTMGAFVAIGCGWSLFFAPRHSGAFVIGVVGVALGVIVMIVVIPFARRELRRDQHKEAGQ